MPESSRGGQPPTDPQDRWGNLRPWLWLLLLAAFIVALTFTSPHLSDAVIF